MPTFYDDFERADGAPGGNWTALINAATISGGRLTQSVQWCSYDTTVSDANQMSVTVHALFSNTANIWSGAAVKCGTSTGSHYYTRIIMSGSNAVFQLCFGYSGTPGIIASHTFSGFAPTYNKHTISWNQGALTATLNDSITLTGTHSDAAANLYGGAHGSGVAAAVADVFIISGATPTLAVDPEVIGNYGACTTVTLTGGATDWTPGTPGAPVFTVDHGTISAQTVNSATSATLTYCPGNYLGTVTFTDPSTQATAGALVTSDPGVVAPPGSGDTWSPYKTLVDATGTLFAPDWLLTDRSPIIPATEEVPGTLDIINAIQQIWLAHFGTWTGAPPSGSGSFGELLALIAGSYTPTVSLYNAARTTSIREELEAVRDTFFEPTSQTYWTLSEAVAAIKGLDNRSITQVYDLVDALQAGSNQDVLDWLNLYLGITGPTLAQLGTMISDIAGVVPRSLQDVLDAIAAIPGTDLTAITNKLNLIQPSEAADLTTITNQLTTIDGNVDDLENTLAAIRTGSNYTFQDILDAIAAITPGGPGESGPALSLWPGQENVTLGAELPLSDDLSVPGPLHGLLFTITDSAPRAQSYMFGAVASWARVGQCLFVTDRGDYERSQTFGIDRQILVPLTMEVAASALIRLNSNWSGTVRPWTRT